MFVMSAVSTMPMMLSAMFMIVVVIFVFFMSVIMMIMHIFMFIKSMTLMFLFLLFCMVMMVMFTVHTVIVFILSISVVIHYRSSFSVDILENFLNIFCVLHPSINIVSYYTPIRHLRSVNFMLMISVKKIRMCSSNRSFMSIMKTYLPIYTQRPIQFLNNHRLEIQIDEFYLACSVHGSQLFFLLCVNRIPKLIQLIVP